MFRNYQNYEICEDGRIWSKKRKKFLKPYTMPNGYQMVCLTDNNGKEHSVRLHKVVYCAVNGLWNLPEGYEINHLDECKTNNHISNLQLCTRKQNLNYGSHNARVAASMKGKINRPPKRVGAYKDDELVMMFESINEANRQGYCKTSVCKCCRNCYLMEGNNKYKGYVWKYLDNN